MDLNGHKQKELEFIEKEKYLAVIFDNSLKCSIHIVTQVNKANQLMKLIRRSYTYLGKNSFPYLVNALVRPHLDCCVSIWTRS